jgi:hypothetical protein
MSSEREKEKVFMASEAHLLEHAAQAPQEGPSVLTIIGFAFLTFNSGVAVYLSSRDLRVGAAWFGSFCFLDLGVLFYCLRLYQRAPPGSPRRENLKMAVWLLTTMLTFALFPLMEYWLMTMGKTTENSVTDPQIHASSGAMLYHPYSPPIP